jgi:mycothiol synthase
MGACAQSSPSASQNPGVEIRPATWDDLGSVHELMAARGRAVDGDFDWMLHHLRDDWELPSFEVGADNWVAEEDGRLLGYAAVSATKELQLVPADPAAGEALLARACAHARTRAYDSLRTVASSADVALLELARRAGFELETEILRMWKRLDGDESQPSWPDGIAVRTYEPADAYAVQALLDEAYREWNRGYVPMSHDDWVRWMTENEDFDPAVWWLAEAGGELLGCALHWRGGWVKDLAVRRSHRGAGLGKALLLHGFAEFARRGVERIGLKVDAANPTGALQLYDRLGFVTDRRQEVLALWL